MSRAVSTRSTAPRGALVDLGPLAQLRAGRVARQAHDLRADGEAGVADGQAEAARQRLADRRPAPPRRRL